MIRNTFAAVSFALLSLSAVTAAQAQTRATVVIQSGQHQHSGGPPGRVQSGAPPPHRREAVPAARRGMAWVPGHWEWRGQRHVWMKGYWVKARPGYHYRESRWQERDGRWQMNRGGWDRDGAGVPNRNDRHPNNPRRN